MNGEGWKFVSLDIFGGLVSLDILIYFPSKSANKPF